MIAVIGDTHLGRSLYGFDLTSYIRKAMYEFFDLCVEKKTVCAIHLGDLFDRPAPTVEQEKMALQWCNEFERAGITLYILVGNHDATSKVRAPSALESIRVAPFRCVRVVDRPLRMDDHHLLLPFPAAGIYASQAEYEKDIRFHDDDVVFSHLNIEGAKVGDEGTTYRAADHNLPPWIQEQASLVVSGHIHRPQRIKRVVIVGAAERLRFDERDQERQFVLVHEQEQRVHVLRAPLELLQVEIDTTVWGTGGNPPSTEGVVRRVLRDNPAGKVVKIVPIVDERSCVDWPAVEGAVYDAGALRVFLAPQIRVHKAPKKQSIEEAVTDPRKAAIKFIRERIEDKHERVALVRMFEQMQKEIDHGEEVRG